ncbi:MAG: hypothetical protein Q4F02_00720 [Candidatus Saccharibacteria bacterium]|nr:hypothetical protein [Candidatus Saccharibacteria bacterium]
MRERNPSDSLKNRVGNFFRRTAEGLKKLGATGLALVTFAGGLAGCSAHNVEATPEVSTSSTTATPKATGESSSTETSSTEKATSKAPDTPTPSSPSSSAEKSSETPTGSAEIVGGEPRYNHPDTIKAHEYIDKTIAPLYTDSYADVYLRWGNEWNGQTITRRRLHETAATFRVAMGVDGAINRRNFFGYTQDASENGRTNPAFTSIERTLAVRKEDGGVDGTTLFVRNSLITPVEYALGQAEGGSRTPVEGEPLDRKRADGVFLLSFWQMQAALGEGAHEQVGIDPNETNDFINMLYEPIKNASTVSNISNLTVESAEPISEDDFYTVQIRDTNLGDKVTERTLFDVNLTLNGRQFCVVFAIAEAVAPIGADRESPNGKFDSWNGPKGKYYEQTLHDQEGHMLDVKTKERLKTAFPIGVKPVTGGIR